MTYKDMALFRTPENPIKQSELVAKRLTITIEIASRQH